MKDDGLLKGLQGMGVAVCNAVASALWAAEGVLQLMFGLCWLLAAQLLAQQGRRPLQWFALFNLMLGASLVLKAQHGVWAFWLTDVVYSLLAVLGYLALWRAGMALVGHAVPPWEERTVALLGCGLVLWWGESPATEPQRLAVTLLANAWVTGRAGWFVFRALHAAGSTGTAWAELATAWVPTVGLVWAAVAGLQQVVRPDAAQACATSLQLALVLFVPIFAINALAGYVSFGRLLRQLRQLALKDPLTGLADQDTVLRALAFEWRRRQRNGHPLALLALSVDGLAALRESWGTATADAVLSELALHLRMRMRSGDVLGHAGEGVFLALMPDTPQPSALRLAQSLVRSVASDPSLHPDGAQSLTLSAGLAAANASDADAAALLARAQALRLCAQVAGGDQLAAGQVQTTAPAGTQAPTLG